MSNKVTAILIKVGVFKLKENPLSRIKVNTSKIL